MLDRPGGLALLAQRMPLASAWIETKAARGLGMHRRTETIIAFQNLTRSRGDMDAVIRFLERDDYRRRTGYAKEYAWHLLKRAELSASQRRRLLEVANRYLHRRMGREFWYMCRFIHRIADDAFRSQVAMLLKSKDELVGKRASLLQAYFAGPEAGEAAHREFHFECLKHKRYVWRPLSWYQAQCE